MQKPANQQFQYDRCLIEAILDPLATICPEGKIIDMNEAFTRITEKTREELQGTFYYSHFTEPEDAKEVYGKIFSNGSVVHHLLAICNPDCTELLFNGSTYKDENGVVVGAVVIGRDVTEQRKTENDLTEARVFAELATSIAEEAKDKAEQAKHIAEDAVKSKQQFLSNMSHEIRTPMNAILGFTKVLLKTPLSFKQKEYLDAIKTSGDALIVLINDILDLAKVDSGKMSFENVPFRISESVSAMLHLFDLKIEEKNLRLIKKFDYRIPPVLMGDPVRLHQIVLNLVSNAAKFTSAGTIIVSTKLLSQSADSVTIEFAVADTGIGIEPNKIGAIFENFQQASSGTSRLYGGTGLGLAIVKQLVEGQGGTVSVTSTPDRGSTFSFILHFPISTETLVPEDETTTPEVYNKNLSVLVVEDIALNQLLMQTLLDEFGFTCEIAENGKIAIEKLAHKAYDIILMDLQMPELDGFKATEYIRNTLKLNLPIIALTADVTTADLAKCTEVGMNDYIAKPVNERLLLAKLVSYAQKSAPKNTNEGLSASLKINRCTNLNYLMQRTKGRQDLAMKMISLFLEQTPPLIKQLKQSFQDENWTALQSAAHKMIPSFSIVGMNNEYEQMAKRIQHYAGNSLFAPEVHTMIVQLESTCAQACRELEQEYNQMKTVNHEHSKKQNNFSC